MSSGSGIEWTEATWNPVTGCTRVSAGCDHCYAVTMTHRLEAMERARRPRNGTENGRKAKPGEKYVGLTVVNPRGDRHFNGNVKTHEAALEIPLRWRKGRRIFVNSMADLFHEKVPFDFIDRVFAVMALCPQHTFQVLTKRPERMAEYMGVHVGICGVRRFDRFKESGRHGAVMGSAHFQIPGGEEADFDWPLPNVWLGTSVENQAAADERIPHLLKCPAAVRFLSVEPILGPVDLSAFFGGPYVGLPGDVVHASYNFGIGWVICGGESGANARPFDVAWARSLREQCKAAGVPFFMKQMGTMVHCRNDHVSDWLDEIGMGLDYVDTIETRMQGDPVRVLLKDRKGVDMSEWPEDLRVREMPEGAKR